MINDEAEVGDYVELNPGKIDNHSRERMVLLIEELFEAKKYKLETLYLAVNLVDRYLAITLSQGCKLPCLYTISLTSITLAAKIEEPLKPSL